MTFDYVNDLFLLSPWMWSFHIISQQLMQSQTAPIHQWANPLKYLRSFPEHILVCVQLLNSPPKKWAQYWHAIFQLVHLSSDSPGLLVHDDPSTDKESLVMRHCSHVAELFFFFPSLIKPRFRLQPMMAGWPTWGLVNMPVLIHSFPPRPKKPSSPRQARTSKEVQCVLICEP